MSGVNGRDEFVRGIDLRICFNGLVMSEGAFEAILFHHPKLETDEVVLAGCRRIALSWRPSHFLTIYTLHCSSGFGWN